MRTTTLTASPTSARTLLRSAVTAGHRAGAALVELALPVDCPGCGAPGLPICAACRAALRGPPRRIAVPGWPQAPPTWSVARYESQVARLIVAWKERGRHDLGRPLGESLRAAVLAAVPAVPGEVLLVPMPSSRAAFRRRGEAHVRRLARVAAGGGQRGAASLRVADVLILRRRVADQAGLAAGARRRNLAGAFAVRPGAAVRLAGRSVVVVDDVITTGATLGEATATLTAAGARVIAGCTVCATPRRRGLSAAGVLD